MIEKDFDVPFVAQLAQLAQREKQIQQHYRPVIGVHKWFARRPGTLFRALLLAEFGDEQLFANRFFSSHDLSPLMVSDPFMGGGTPPRIEERAGQYLGYFENEYGEQMIFVFDQRGGTGRLYAGDAGWETPYEVVDGVAKELILRPEEGLWLRACWEAATAGDG
jgi:hypothetical protein